VEETMKRLCPFEHKTTSLAWNPIDGFLQVIGVGCFMIFFKIIYFILCCNFGAWEKE